MKKLSTAEKKIILDKGTEPPFSGKYYRFNENGIYACKQCGAFLYRSSDKFDTGCGWPSFDDAIPNAIKCIPDIDGLRTEITCDKCGAHIGHLFLDEGLTAKNVRHCVNSIALQFQQTQAEKSVAQIEMAIFAGGCFWGVEHLMKKLPGVISILSGYIGGTMANPSYEDICYRDTGHTEAVQIFFDSRLISYETLAKRFFEIHDPEQINRQGPDIGKQYRSEIFYTTPQQKQIALNLINTLRDKGYQIATKVTPATTFWKAEDYHQNYYEKTGKKPYCHQYKKKF